MHLICILKDVKKKVLKNIKIGSSILIYYCVCEKKIYIFNFYHGSYWCTPKNQSCLWECAINMGQICKYIEIKI